MQKKKYSSLHPHGECKMYSLFLLFFFPNLSHFLMNLLKICSRATLLVFLFFSFLLKIRGIDISGRCGQQDKQKIPTHCKSFT